MSSKKILSALSVFTLMGAATLGMSGVTHAQTFIESKTSDITIEITAWNLSIGIDNDENLNFGTKSIPTSSAAYTQAFWEYFRVEDMKGSTDGYHTTLQMSGALDNGHGETIPASNIRITTNGSTITTIDGTANNNVKISSGIETEFTAIDSPKNFIERWYDSSGRVGRYGIKPEMEITVPAYQAVGQYSGTLLYTLYEN